MVFPVLNINQDDSNLPTFVSLIDTDMAKDDNPILQTSGGYGNDLDMFVTLLTAFLNQYACGYEDGFDDGIWNGLEEGDDNTGEDI